MRTEKWQTFKQTERKLTQNGRQMKKKKKTGEREGQTDRDREKKKKTKEHTKEENKPNIFDSVIERRKRKT